MYRLRARVHFDSAHKLENYEGECARLHGHRWEVEVSICSEELDETGFVIDFKDVKEQLKDILPDHRYLNEEYEFNPTAENISRHIYEELRERLDIREGAWIDSITVWESPNSSVTYKPCYGIWQSGTDIIGAEDV